MTSPIRHPLITLSSDHLPPGSSLCRKRTVVPATQQDTDTVQLLAERCSAAVCHLEC